MTYEIAYFSRTGNTEKLAKGMAQNLFSGKARMVDLASQKVTSKADVYLIGFGMKNGVVPYPVMECLEALEGKTILFFATCAIPPSDGYKKHIEQLLKPFMPEECDYKGIFLCPGRVPAETLQSMRNTASQSPERQKAEQFLKCCEQAEGHPSQRDIEQACAFVRNAIRT